MSKITEAQINLFCTGCKVKTCDEQNIGCKFRLYTKPNWLQKRKAIADAKREAKRAVENPRNKYWREWQARRRIKLLLAA